MSKIKFKKYSLINITNVYNIFLVIYISKTKIQYTLYIIQKNYYFEHLYFSYVIQYFS